MGYNKTVLVLNDARRDIESDALNTFLNLNCYRYGSYIKTWNGREGNAFLGGLMSFAPSVSFDSLIEKLDAIYKRLHGRIRSCRVASPDAGPATC